MAASKPIKPVTAYGFHGMNNLPDRPANLFDKNRLITPHLIVNAEVMDGGVILPRGGFRTVQSLTGLHSLAGEERGLSIMLGVAQGVLYQLEGAWAGAIGEIPGPRTQMTYVQIDNTVYLSNLYWNGSLDLATMTLQSWGVTLPPAPTINFTSGSLPPGKYLLCYTRLDNGRMSGAGAVAAVNWQGQSQGLVLTNLEDGLVAWITHPNGDAFFLASVNSLDVITAQAPTFKPLTGMNIIPPPPFAHFGFGHGRIWGVRGKDLYYSEVNELGQWGWFSRKVFHFLEELVMVIPVNEGVFVSSATSTWFLVGGDPAKMTYHRIGDGAIPGTYVSGAQVPGAMTALDGLLRPKGPRMPLPVWMNATGFITGTQGGTLSHMTVDRLRINPRSQGAGFYHIKNGVPKILISLSGPATGDIDEELQGVSVRGRLCIPAPLEVIGSGGITLGFEGD